MLPTTYGAVPSLITLGHVPRTATGENTAEIHLPGSPYLVQALMDSLFATQLVRLAQPGEFTQRAFLHGKLDLAQAEAVMALVSASGEAEAIGAAALLRGGFSRELQVLVSRLEDLCARLELSFDFDEEAAEQADESAFASTARSLLDQLNHAVAPSRTISSEAPSVVLVGATNVGKSSLFNVLVGGRRAAVADERGTTRDAVEAPVVLGGIPVRLVDTAGFKPPENDIEREALEMAAARVREASVVVVCGEAAPFDRLREAANTPSAPPSPSTQHSDVDTRSPDAAISAALASLPPHCVIRVATKSDGDHREDHGGRDPRVIVVSAHTGRGIDALREAIVARLGMGSARDAVWVSSRVRALCDEATGALGDAVEILEGRGPLEAASGMARTALSSLREALGRGASTDILDHAFANFCIGK